MDAPEPPPKRRRWFQIHLSTAVLMFVVGGICVSIAFAVTYHSSPWQVARRPDPNNYVVKQSSTSPDGRFSFDGYVIRDLGTSQILWRIEWSDFSSNPVYKTRYLTGSFVDSNTIELALIDELKESRAIEVIVLQKLSPEDWWKVIALNCSVAAFLAIFTGILCEVIMRCETRKP